MRVLRRSRTSSSPGVLGFGEHRRRDHAQATAAWGAAAGGFAVPIVLDSGYLQGVCKVPDGIEIGDTCAFWYNNGDRPRRRELGLHEPRASGTSTPVRTATTPVLERSAGLDRQRLPGDPPPQRNPPGSEPTYVCNDTGHSAANWRTSSTRIEHDRSSSRSTTATGSSTRAARLAVPGHARQVRHHRVHLAADPESTRATTPRRSARRSTAAPAAPIEQRASTTAADLVPDRPRTARDGVPVGLAGSSIIAGVHVSPKKPSDPEYRQCVPGDLSPTCALQVRPGRHARSRGEPPAATDLKVTYGWSMNGTRERAGSSRATPTRSAW